MCDPKNCFPKLLVVRPSWLHDLGGRGVPTKGVLFNTVVSDFCQLESKSEVDLI